MQEKTNSNFKTPLEIFLRQIEVVRNPELTIKEVAQFIETKRDVTFWEDRFSAEEIKVIKKDFEQISYDNIISQNQILNYLGLKDFLDTEIGDRLFLLIKKLSLNS